MVHLPHKRISTLHRNDVFATQIISGDQSGVLICNATSMITDNKYHWRSTFRTQIIKPAENISFRTYVDWFNNSPEYVQIRLWGILQDLLIRWNDEGHDSNEWCTFEGLTTENNFGEISLIEERITELLLHGLSPNEKMKHIFTKDSTVLSAWRIGPDIEVV